MTHYNNDLLHRKSAEHVAEIISGLSVGLARGGGGGGGGGGGRVGQGSAATRRRTVVDGGWKKLHGWDWESEREEDKRRGQRAEGREMQ